jgi:hypothetical protein
MTMNAVERELVGQGPERSPNGEPTEQLDILTAIETRIVPARCQSRLPAEHDGGADNEDHPARQPECLKLLFRHWAKLNAVKTPAVSIDKARPTAPADYLRIALSRPDLSLESVRHRNIVGVQPGDPGVFGLLQADIAVPADTAMLINNQSDAAIMTSHVPDDVPSIVARPIIADKQLETRIGLAEHTVDRLAYERCGIVRRHHNADHGAFFVATRLGRVPRNRDN